MKYFLFMIPFILSCEGSQGPVVKLFISKPAKGGLYRAQANELIPYSNSEDYLAMSKSDGEALLNYCLGSQGIDINSPKIKDKIKEISQNGY